MALQVLAMGAVALTYGAAGEPPASDNGPWLPVLGWLGFASGGGLIAWGFQALARARSFSVMPKPLVAGDLVETGPYRLIRHPVYAGLIVGGLGLAAIRSSVPTAAATLALFVILDLKRRREEAWLATRFPGYAAYRARTRALVPFLW